MKMRICSMLLVLLLLVSVLSAVTVSAQEDNSGGIRLPGLSFGDTDEEGTKPPQTTTKPVEDTKPKESKPAKDTADKTPETTTQPTTQPATQPTEQEPDSTEEAIDLTEPTVLTDGAEEEGFPWEIVLVAVVAAAIGAGVTVLVMKKKS